MGLSCFMVSLWVVCPALRPRPRPWTSPIGPPISPPLIRQQRPAGICVISWLIHTAFHLAVYASCRHRWRRCKTRLQCGATRFLTGFGPAWEALRRFQPLAVPRLSPFVHFLCLCHFGFFLVSVFGAFPAAMPLHDATYPDTATVGPELAFQSQRARRLLRCAGILPLKLPLSRHPSQTGRAVSV